MTRETRQALMAGVKSVVVKLGTNVLANEKGLLDEAQIGRIADQVIALESQGRRVVIVSSGAIAAGLGDLALPERPDALPQLQACAAVGQAKLMMMFDSALARHGTPGHGRSAAGKTARRAGIAWLAAPLAKSSLRLAGRGR